MVLGIYFHHSSRQAVNLAIGTVTASKGTSKDPIKTHFTIWWNFVSQWKIVISESEKICTNQISVPGNRWGIFCQHIKTYWECHDGLRWFVWGLWGVLGLAFCSFLFFSFRNSFSLDLHFFLCYYSFYYVFAIRNSSHLIVAFFCCCGYERTILLLLSLFLCYFVVKRALGT